MNIAIEQGALGYYATDINTYCGCGECLSPIGHGATPDAAVADLLEQIEDE